MEDESDVKAAKELQEEVKADCAEFDENEAENNNQSVNNENDESIRKKYDDRVENEFKSIEQQVCSLFAFTDNKNKKRSLTYT